MGPTLKRCDLLGDGLPSVAGDHSQSTELGQTNKFITDLHRQFSGRDQYQALNENLGWICLFHQGYPESGSFPGASMGLAHDIVTS
jgi:hypothetical protein